LVHVLDASDPEIDTRRAAVEGILEEMGLGGKPRVTVLNKIDRCEGETARALAAVHNAIAVSAARREGFAGLTGAIVEKLRFAGIAADRGSGALNSARQ
jgi:GTP-binding protein HflX